MKYVHIAGTNGKGSCSAMISSILCHAGYRTGLYTSPYINRFNERIQINGTQIPDNDLARITTRVSEACSRIIGRGFRRPTIFEIITAVCFCWFKEQNCDICVLEVGLGGRLDATNSIETSEVSVIMNIGYDHMERLGSTLELIAAEKAAIIKENGDVVCYRQSEGVESVFKKYAAQRNARIWWADGNKASVCEQSADGSVFHFEGRRGLKISLLGNYQIRNAVVALKIADALNHKGWEIGEEAIRSGLLQARWPGRMEVLSRNPLVILDGAHNPQGVSALCESIETLFPGEKVIFVVGVLADKDYSDEIKTAERLAEEFITLTPPNVRALTARALAEEIENHSHVPVTACNDISEALGTALVRAGISGKIVIFGSLYHQGPVRTFFGKDSY